MHTKSLTCVVSALAGAALVGISSAGAAIVSIPGNYMTSMPIYGANGPQGGGGSGYTAGSNVTYPANPAVADGDTSTGWGAGTNLANMLFSVVAAEGFKADNTPEAPGYYQPDHFVQGTYGAIKTFRIYAGTGGYQNNPPTQIGIHYSTETHTETSGGWWGNPPSTPGGGAYGNPVTILGVSGGTPTLSGDPNDAVAISLGSANFTADGEGHQYFDLSVNIPAGATAIQFDFGKSGYDPGNPTVASYTYALQIYEIQASSVPEPASLGILALGGLMTLRRHRKAIGV